MMSIVAHKHRYNCKAIKRLDSGLRTTPWKPYSLTTYLDCKNQMRLNVQCSDNNCAAEIDCSFEDFWDLIPNGEIESY